MEDSVIRVVFSGQNKLQRFSNDALSAGGEKAAVL